MGRIINQHLNCCSADENAYSNKNEVSLMQDYPYRTPIKNLGFSFNIIRRDSPTILDNLETAKGDGGEGITSEDDDDDTFAAADLGTSPLAKESSEAARDRADRGKTGMVVSCPWYKEMSIEEEEVAVPEEPHDQEKRMEVAE